MNEERAEILRLMRQAGCYDMKTVTIMHRRVEAEDRWIGRSLDQWLDSLDATEIQVVLHRLRKQA